MTRARAACLVAALALGPLPCAHALAGDPGAAVTAPPEASEVAESPEAVARRVQALLDADRWREALAATASDRVPSDAPSVRAVRAEALYRAGRIAEAGAVLDATPADELPPRALALAGLVARAEGRDEQALAWMDRAVGGDPADPLTWFRAAEATSTRAEAVRRLERYLELDSDAEGDRARAARGTIDVLTALGERPVWTAIERPATVRVPLQLVLGPKGDPLAAIVRARLGRRRVALLLDTGSSGLFVEDALARGGFRPLAEETTFGGGGEGRHRSRRGTFAELRLGDLVLGDALVSTAPGRLDAAGRYRGVLGLAPLAGYRIELDLGGGTMRLDDDGDAVDGAVPYWTVNGQMLVEAEVGGQRALFLLDTGAGTSVIDLDTARTVPGARVGDEASVRSYGGAVTGARRVDGVEVRFAGLSTEGPLHGLDLGLRSRLGGVEVAGYLGMDVLGGVRITVDTRARRVLVSPGRR